MTQRDVEATLGRLLTDSAFRIRFFTQPETTVVQEELTLTRLEIQMLGRMPIGAVLELASHIDDRLRR